MTGIDVHALVREMAAAALNAQAELAQERTRKFVPKDTKALEESVFVDRASVSDLTAQVGTASPYAIFVHEDMQDEHPNGGQPKFMESAVIGGNSPRLLQQAAERAARRVAG